MKYEITENILFQINDNIFYFGSVKILTDDDDNEIICGVVKNDKDSHEIYTMVNNYNDLFYNLTTIAALSKIFNIHENDGIVINLCEQKFYLN